MKKKKKWRNKLTRAHTHTHTGIQKTSQQLARDFIHQQFYTFTVRILLMWIIRWYRIDMHITNCTSFQLEPRSYLLFRWFSLCWWKQWSSGDSSRSLKCICRERKWIIKWNNNERVRVRERENSPANTTEMNMKAHLFTHCSKSIRIGFSFFPLHIRVRIKNRSCKWRKKVSARFSMIVVLFEAAAHFTRLVLA